MAAEYYYMQNGKPIGPLSVAKLRQAIDAKKLPSSVAIWTEGMEGWHPAASVLEIFPPTMTRPVEAPALPQQKRPERPIAAQAAVSAWNPASEPSETLEAVAAFDELVVLSPPPIQTRTQVENNLEFAETPLTAVPGTVGLVKAKDYLQIVRRGTCYRTLRTVIEVCYALLLFLSGLSMLGNVGLGLVMAVSRTDSQGSGVVWIFGSLIGGALVIALVIAAKESAMLLIDIADATMHEHSRLRNQVPSESST